MKRIFAILTALVLFVCLAIPAAAADTQIAKIKDATSANLKFKEDGTFKIIQVSDTQEFFVSSTLTQDFLYDLAVKEKPDLFILTGDNISSGAAKSFPNFLAKAMIQTSIDALMCVFDRIYKEFGIPVTMVYGNHDNEIGQDKVRRAEQFAMYEKHPSFIGYYIDEADKGTNDREGQHYGTHNLVVKDKTGTNPAVNLWMFDSGSYDADGDYSCVQPAQIAWFNRTHTANPLPSLAFQHIIVKEIYDFIAKDAEGKYQLPADTIGTLRENPCPGNSNHGLYTALCNAGTMAIFTGHDHVNTFEIIRPGTDLINTSCAGFGSYGDIDLRGARVITLDESNLGTYDTELVTIQGFYGPHFLYSGRLSMYQSMSVAGIITDWISFKPLLWLLGLLGVTLA